MIFQTSTQMFASTLKLDTTPESIGWIKAVVQDRMQIRWAEIQSWNIFIIIQDFLLYSQITGKVHLDMVWGFEVVVLDTRSVKRSFFFTR